MNKYLIILFVEILTAVAFYFALNTFMPMDFNYTCPIDGKEYHTTFAILISVVYLVSEMYATILYMFFDMAERKTLKAYKKEREKNCISEAEKDSKIQALENKIKTLETALNSVIKKNNQ